ncbi:lymphocyte antigen 6D-like [Osmerus eperlanus]|uniref:lymphocyte antigen 6D-like n=1 Tax=Osmerus eperlanus TaxID=29151 RepID=UPI002E0DF5A2
MNSFTLTLTVLIATFSAAQALRCHTCTSIHPDQPSCAKSEVTEEECGGIFTYCAKIKMHAPAYGEVLKCATERECNSAIPPQVERSCCTTDLCN